MINKSLEELSNKKDNLIIFACYLLGLLTYSLRIWIIYTVVGIDFGYLNSIYFSVLILGISIIQLLPGNLGLKEASFSLGSLLFGHHASIDLLVALIDRGVQLLTLSILGLYYQIKILGIKLNFFFQRKSLGINDV